MQKNQIIFGECTDYTFEGLGVVKYDTFCVFVKDMLVGEKGDIVITLVKKNFAYGRLLKRSVTSSERVNPICTVYKPCGGCQIQHFSTEEQAKFKHDLVQNNMDKIAKLDVEVQPVITMKKPCGYRNKVMLPVGVDKNNNLTIGFYRYNSHEIIDVNDCKLQSDCANALVKKLKELFIRYHMEKAIRHVMIRDMQRTESIMLVLVCYKEKVDKLDELVKEIVQFDPKIKSIIQNINAEETNVVLGKKEKLLYGDYFIEDILCDLRFKISSHSFYQVNTYQTEVLYNKAIELAALKKEDTVLDLYCGVGTIGLIASKQVKKVIGVEIIQQAIDNAKENAKLNGITNSEFICGDAQVITADLYNQGTRFDCIFVDPPRKGCSKETIDMLINLKSPKIVYVSCDPSTLARDLSILKEYYDIKIIQPVDMFPQTYHVETVVCLSNKNEKPKDYVEICVDAEDYYRIKDSKKD